MSGSEVIYIRAQAKANSLTSLLFGGLGLLLSVLMLSVFPQTLSLAGMFLLSASLVACLIAWFKWREPRYSLLLARQYIDYRHRCGGWRLRWDNIQRVGVPKVYRQLQHQPLALVGIQIKDYAPLLDSLSPRLTSHLLLEQRALLVHQQGAQQAALGAASCGSGGSCADGNSYAQSMLDDAPVTLENGQRYTGLQAMFVRRMQHFRALFGYELLIAASELDRSEADFVGLLNACLRSARPGAD